MVSVVIVNWNSGSLLDRCASSLRAHAPDCEIVIVDNASADASLSINCAVGPELVVCNPRNLGFAAACNQGWRAAKGDPVLFLNPDTECLPGSVERLARRLEKDTGIWAVGGMLLHPSGAPQTGFNVRAFPTVGAVAADMMLLDEIWPRNPWTRRYRMSDWNADSGCDVDQPAAACLMVRRSTLESLDGYDERFTPAWFEDVDFCRRIRNSGGRIGFEPKARFLHHGAVSLRSLNQEEFLRFYHTNQLRYFSKHEGAAAAACVRRWIVAGLVLRSIFAWLSAPVRGRAAAESARASWRCASLFAGTREKDL
jgi:N-acetylglucosaminyl-diphospho-decaprenol L-rhamnosyltransferase